MIETEQKETKSSSISHRNIDQSVALSSLLSSPHCFHPESKLSYEEHNAVQQLRNAFETNPKHFEILLYKLKDLSNSALYCFANSCYRYLEQHWPTAHKLSMLDNCKKELKALAIGRILFRCEIENESAYYWGSLKADNNSGKPGLFYPCYPTLAISRKESVFEIFNEQPITGKDFDLCQTYFELQQSTAKLFELNANLYTELYIKRWLITKNFYASLIINLRQTWLYFRSGPVMEEINLHKLNQSVFYLAQAIGIIERYSFTQQQPLPADLLSAAGNLTNLIEHKIFPTAQKTLLTIPLSPLEAKLLEFINKSAKENSTFEEIYKLSKEIGDFLEKEVLAPPSIKKSILDSWLILFKHAKKDVSRLCDVVLEKTMDRSIAISSESNDLNLLNTTHQWVLELTELLHQHGQSSYANTLLLDYEEILRIRHSSLVLNISVKEGYGQNTELLTKKMEICNEKLANLSKLPRKSHSKIEQKNHSSPLPLYSADKYKKEILGWRKTLESAVTERNPEKIFAVLRDNTHFVANILKNICQEIEQQLGPAPYGYTLVAAGSFSRGEISPASDLDLAILVEKENALESQWFKSFLQLLQWKLNTCLPKDVLSFENETIGWILGGYWINTPNQLITELLLPQQIDNPDRKQESFSFGAQWFRWVYGAGNKPKQDDTLFAKYQAALSEFFHTIVPPSASRNYRDLASWSLEKHVDNNFSHLPNTETIHLPFTHQHQTTQNITIPLQVKTANLKYLLSLITNTILCYGRFHNIAIDTTTTLDVLEGLHEFLPKLFIIRLRNALKHLYTWRLHAHWEWLHHFSTMDTNEVILWPEEEASQKILQENNLLRGFYLDQHETQIYYDILETVAEVIQRSLKRFRKLAEKPESKTNIVTTQGPLQPAIKFDPLAASFEVTLEELSILSINKHSARICPPQVKWLARIISTYLEELSSQKTEFKSSPGSDQSKADEEFHLQIYWRIPQQWRSVYLETLSQHLPPKNKYLIPLLSSIPNAVGWRLSIEEEDRRWYKSLSALHGPAIEGEPPPEIKQEIAAGKAVWISWTEQGKIFSAALHPRYASTLFDEKSRQWKLKHNNTGNHHLFRIVTEEDDFWLKLYPEQAGTEYFIKAIDRRFGNSGTAAHQLYAIHHAPLQSQAGVPKNTKLERSAALISKHVGESKETLHHICKHQPAMLEQINFISFIRAFLRILLTNPEDDKGNDYFIINSQLIRIDNERAFLPATYLSGGWINSEELQVKSIIYCLDQMQIPWNEEQYPEIKVLLDDFNKIHASALIIDILQDIKKQQESWNKLFPEQSVAQHANLKLPGVCLPVFMLPEGLETTLLKRVNSLQTALRRLKPAEITALNLLAAVEPKLARYYNEKLFQGKFARDPKKPQANVLARFNEVAGRYYNKQTSTLSVKYLFRVKFRILK